MNKVALGTVCDIKNGYAFKSANFRESGTPLIRISSFDNGPVFFNEKTVYVDIENIKSKSDFKVEKGDVLIALSGATTGKFGLYLSDEPSMLNQRIGLLKSGSSKHLNDKYFYYYLFVLQKDIYRMAGGAAQPNISTKAISEFKIPLPPLPQQKKIAAILDAADAYRQKTKALIAKYEELTQSLFLDMFGDLVGDKIPLSTFCEINPKKSQISSLNKEISVSFVPMKDVSEKGELIIKEERSLKNVWSGFTYFQEDDVVFAKITPCMENGKGAIMKGLKNKIGFGTTEFHVLRPLQKISTSEYVFHLTHSKYFRKLAEVNMSGSAGQKRVPKDFFTKYEIVPPSIKLQERFAKRVNAIELQKKTAQSSLKKAEDLFNCLLQKAFKGELI